MLSLLGMSGRPPTEKKIGDLRQDKDIGEQLFELKTKMTKTMNKRKKEIHDYRELSKFNEQLAKSYSANLKVIVDISKLLNAYNEFFDLFKQKLAEIDTELGIPISSDDFEYMKKLTVEQMFQLEDVFKKETGNLKKIYTKYGKQKEYNDVDIAEQLFESTKMSGKQTYDTLVSAANNSNTVNKMPENSFVRSQTQSQATVGGKKVAKRKNAYKK